MIALSQDDIEGAGSYLLIAGSTPGSPQLDSFGPDFVLAKKLLERGEKETVLRYFDRKHSVWGRKFGRGVAQLGRMAWAQGVS